MTQNFLGKISDENYTRQNIRKKIIKLYRVILKSCGRDRTQQSQNELFLNLGWEIIVPDV